MFEEFFHLRENPFALAPNPRFIFQSHEHGEALAHLRYWVENGEGFVLITGEVGTGKTTALFDLLAQLPTAYAIAFVANSTLTIPELLEEICRRFGLEVPPAPSKPALLGTLERFLLSRVERGLGSLLILDEAQNFDSAALEEIRLLSNLERADGKLIQIALVGQPELERKLARPELRQLRQRIGIRYRLGPLTEEETLAYLHHRVAVAGGDAAAVFGSDSARAVHRLTHGIPREINIVASQALINAFVAGAARVLPEHVQAVVDEFAWSSIFGEEIPVPRARLPRPEVRGTGAPASPPATANGGAASPPAPAPILPPAPAPESAPPPPMLAPPAAAPAAPPSAAPAPVAAGLPGGMASPSAPGPDGDRLRRPALGVVKGGSGERARPEPGAAEPPVPAAAPPRPRSTAGGGAAAAGPPRVEAGHGTAVPPRVVHGGPPRQAILFAEAAPRLGRRSVSLGLSLLLLLCAGAAGFFVWQWARGPQGPAMQQPGTAAEAPVSAAAPSSAEDGAREPAPEEGERPAAGEAASVVTAPASPPASAGEATSVATAPASPPASAGEPASMATAPASPPASAGEATSVATAPASPPASAEPAASPSPPTGEFRIQVESFIDGDQQTIAATRAFWARRTRSPVDIRAADVEGDLWHRVLVGSYATRADAAAALETFQDEGIVRADAMIVPR